MHVITCIFQKESDALESLAAKLSNISVEDIDSEDKENPLLCSEYINEIYTYMRIMEISYQVTTLTLVLSFHYVQN